MKKSSLLLAFLLPVMCFAQSEQFIEWSSVKRLNWEDYLANPNNASDAAAITATALGMEYNVKGNVFTFKLSCRFSKTKSWVKHKTELILSHEQGHFDITEIFARKLNKEIKNYKFNPRRYQSDLDNIYKRIMSDKEEFQNEYDKKTDYSRDKKKQAEWLDKIKRELDDLKPYANYN